MQECPDADLYALSCNNCGIGDIAVLGFVSSKVQKEAVILCRECCFNTMANNPTAKNWNCKIWTELEKDASKEDPKKGIKIFEKEEEKFIMSHVNRMCENVPNRFITPLEYFEMFQPLVWQNAMYEKEDIERQFLPNVKGKWETKTNLKKKITCFVFNNDNKAIRFNLGDKLRVRSEGVEWIAVVRYKKGRFSFSKNRGGNMAKI